MVIEFVLRRREVEGDVAADVRSFDSVGGQGPDPGFGAAVLVDHGHEVQVVASFDGSLSPPGVLCLHGSWVPESLVERGQPLLAVEQVVVGVFLALAFLGALDRSFSQLHLPVRFEREERSDGEVSRNADEELLDPVVVPNPTALEVGKDDLPLVGLCEKFFERYRIGSEHVGPDLMNRILAVVAQAQAVPRGP